MLGVDLRDGMAGKGAPGAARASLSASLTASSLHHCLVRQLISHACGFGVDQGGGCQMAALPVQAAGRLGPVLATGMFRLALIWMWGPGEGFW